MHKLAVAILLVLASLALASPAAAETIQVVIRDNGFQPKNLTVEFGDVVTWVNEGKVNHQVEATNGAFTSPILRYKSEYSYRFVFPRTIAYRDALNPSLTGSITVKDPAPPAKGIAAFVSPQTVIVGNPVLVTGAVSAEFGTVENQTIEVLQKPYGATSFTVAGTVKTGPNGTWQYSARPTILTTYYARWVEQKANSRQHSASVRPRVSIAYNRARNRFTARVLGIEPRSGRYVNLQRLSASGRWVNVRKIVVGLSNAGVGTVRLPAGAFRYRLFLTVNQAGPGYLGSNSGTLLIGSRK